MISTGTLANIMGVSNASILKRFKNNQKRIKNNSKIRAGKRYYDGKAVAVIIKSLKLNKYHKMNDTSHAKDLRTENKRQSQSI